MDACWLIVTCNLFRTTKIYTVLYYRIFNWGVLIPFVSLLISEERWTLQNQPLLILFEYVLRRIKPMTESFFHKDDKRFHQFLLSIIFLTLSAISFSLLRAWKSSLWNSWQHRSLLWNGALRIFNFLLYAHHLLNCSNSLDNIFLIKDRIYFDSIAAET